LGFAFFGGRSMAACNFLYVMLFSIGVSTHLTFSWQQDRAGN
jgi:hypothetical protein